VIRKLPPEAFSLYMRLRRLISARQWAKAYALADILDMAMIE
jgi:hypothetical protein